MNLCSQKVIVTTPLLKIDFFAKTHLIYATLKPFNNSGDKKLGCHCVIIKLCITGNIHTGLQLYFYKDRVVL